MASYNLVAPIPTPSVLSPGFQAVALIGYMTVFENSQGNKYVVANLGGDETTPSYAHIIDLTAGQSTIQQIHTTGCMVTPCYSPSLNKMWVANNYGGNGHGSFGELDLATMTFTEFVNNLEGDSWNWAGPLICEDGKIYHLVQGWYLYSYDPSVGYPAGWKSYGEVHPTAPSCNYGAFDVPVGDAYVYVAVSLNAADGVSYTLRKSLLSGSPSWSSWEFDGLGDKRVQIYRLSSDPTSTIIRRTLSDDSVKWYTVANGVFTEVEAPDPSSGVNTYDDPRKNLGSLGYDDPDSWTQFATYYDLTINAGAVCPIKDAQEASVVGVKEGAGDYVYYESAFSGTYGTPAISSMRPRFSKEVFLGGDGYTAGARYDYQASYLQVLGSTVQSHYRTVQGPGNLEYLLGYPNDIKEFDRTLDWTLDGSNNTAYFPSDDSKPNPFKINALAATIHYWFRGVCDANGIMWFGGNTTRQSDDYGVIMYYDPTDATRANIKDSIWTTANGIKLVDLCACLNGTKILWANNNDEIGRIDATAKTDDAVTINPAGEDSKSMMAEVAYDRVIVLNKTATTWTIGLLQPSDMTWITALQALGIEGLPFGWSDSAANRMMWQMVVGPDNQVWLYAGNNLYRVPQSLIFELIYADSTYMKVGFSEDGRDLLGWTYVGDGTKMQVWRDIFSNTAKARIYGDLENPAKVGGVTRPAKINGMVQ